MNLKEVKTCELVAELERREGVERVRVEQGTKDMLMVEGPATVLTVID